MTERGELDLGDRRESPLGGDEKVADPDEERHIEFNTNGTPFWTSKGDRMRENGLFARIGERWEVEWERYPLFCVIDGYLVKHQALVALVEVKCREITSYEHKTVFMNASKWLGLYHASAAMGVPGLFVAGWNDGVDKWIDVKKIPATVHRLLTAEPQGKRELVIEVPIREMKDLKKG